MTHAEGRASTVTLARPTHHRVSSSRQHPIFVGSISQSSSLLVQVSSVLPPPLRQRIGTRKRNTADRYLFHFRYQERAKGYPRQGIELPLFLDRLAPLDNSPPRIRPRIRNPFDDGSRSILLLGAVRRRSARLFNCDLPNQRGLKIRPCSIQTPTCQRRLKPYSRYG